MHTPNFILPILSFISLLRLDYGLMFDFCLGNTWPPLTLSSSTHRPALTRHPLRFNYGLSRHASRQPQQCTMASSGIFICPFTLLDSHFGVNLHVIIPEENPLVDRSGFEEGSLPQLGSSQVFPWESLPRLRSFVKERLALSALLNCHCSSRCVSGSPWHSTSGSI